MMASISYDRKMGRRTVQFVGGDRKRRSVRLGKVSARQADTARLHIEHLLACKTTGTAPRATTTDWIVALPDLIRRRLERTGLIEPQERVGLPTLGQWLDTYLSSRRDVKPGTAVFYGHTKRNLLEFFGTDRLIDTITAGDADEFRIYLTTAVGLAENTVRRRLRMAKQFLNAAVRKQIIGANPFADLKTADRPNEAKFYFITTEEAQALLKACPDGQWRLIFALCRFGGLRCPSEVLRLRWEDIDWERNRFTVHASKTEHHDGGIRTVPIFPELRQHLLEAYEEAEPGTENVITRYRESNQNLRTQFSRIIKRAGLEPWPKLFQNLRSTRETELTQTFPVHVVCKWIGNTQPVAAKHYLQVTEDHYAEAAQNPVQNQAARGRNRRHAKEEETGEPCLCGHRKEDATPCSSMEPSGMGPAGFEPATNGL